MSATENSVDKYDLNRFVEAQSGVYGRVLEELRAGQKRSHWMWFIFPQIKGLGNSSMALRYAISSLEEAQAYLAHPVLGERLRECTGILLALKGGRTVDEIFGYPDDLKFHSSMTLFAAAAAGTAGGDGRSVFQQVLQLYFGGELDRGTIARISPQQAR
jgi:uncharacterized protein (DUF1810 family)